ncbi:TPA: HNH endonuclease [Yersinia enterocolitica]
MSAINKEKELALSLNSLKLVLHYDPISGVFRWLKNMSSKALKGEAAGSICLDGYRHIKVAGNSYKAHRLAWLYMTGEWPAGEIDHQFLDKDDNIFSHLRLATPSQNSVNRSLRSDNRSGIKGVSWNEKGKKWSAEITVNGKRFNLGFYTDKEDAANAYRTKSGEFHKEFARLN